MVKKRKREHPCCEVHGLMLPCEDCEQLEETLRAAGPKKKTIKKRKKKRKKIVRYDDSLYVGRIYPQARYCTGEFVEFRPRVPECWEECVGDKVLDADSYPELASAFDEQGGVTDQDGNPTLPDLGKGYWMLVRPLPEIKEEK